MSKVVEMLKEKGIAERIQRNVDRSVALFGKDVPQEEIDKSVRIILILSYIEILNLVTHLQSMRLILQWIA